jgi:hypothetical protein
MRCSTSTAAWLMLLTPLPSLAQQNIVAADPCARYQWDVTRERALFAAPASSVTAATTAATDAKSNESLPRIAPERAYQVLLTPSTQVSFPFAPGKVMPATGSYAGILALRVPASGSYRISVNLPLWIDVVSDGHLTAPSDYEAQHDCDAPRKIVQFSLEANKPLLVQLSGAGETSVRIAVVRAAGN